MDDKQKSTINHRTNTDEAPSQGHGLLEMHESEKDTKKSEMRKRVFKEIREWVVSLVVAFVVVMLLRTFIFTLIRVDGPSMSDTLLNGDRLFVTVLDVRLNGPDRFDVVITHYPDRKENFVKRVIGIPGDTIEVTDGVLSINGQVYDEPYLTPSRIERFSRSASNFTVTLGEGEYFVMGDNRDDSNDSRRVGVIQRGMIIGKVRQILFPFSRFGSVPGSELYNTPQE